MGNPIVAKVGGLQILRCQGVAVEGLRLHPWRELTEDMNVFLIGYRCTGKTTVGKTLARRLGCSFVDTDRMIVTTTGTDIAGIVDEKGWAYFRDMERRVMQAVAVVDRQVVATGGGVILDQRNVSAMQRSGKIVWLRASEKTITGRILADDTTAGNRPSLTGQGLIQEITEVLSKRRPLYERAMDVAIDTDTASIAVICDRIQAAFPMR